MENLTTAKNVSNIFTSNLMGAATYFVFNGIDRTNYYALFIGLVALIALVIAWRSRSKFGAGRYRESEPSM